MSIFFTKNLDKEEDLRVLNEAYEKVNKVNMDSFKNIDKMQELNKEATILSENIKSALPLNSELIKNSEIAKSKNDLLSATNVVADDKNNKLNESLKKTQEVIKDLNESQNLPKMRQDINIIQEGLNQNQSLEYRGASITASNTLTGRTRNMKLVGATYKNQFNYMNLDMNLYIPTDPVSFILSCPKGDNRAWEDIANLGSNLQEGKKYTLFIRNVGVNVGILEYRTSKLGVSTSVSIAVGQHYKTVITIDSNEYFAMKFYNTTPLETRFQVMLVEGDNVPEFDSPFAMALKSFGDFEGKPKVKSLISAPNCTFDTDSVREWNQETGCGKLKGMNTPITFKGIGIKPNTTYTIAFIMWAEGSQPGHDFTIGESNFFESQTTISVSSDGRKTLFKKVITTTNMSNIEYPKFILRTSSFQDSKIIHFDNFLFVEGNHSDDYMSMLSRDGVDTFTIPQYANVLNPNSDKQGVDIWSYNDNFMYNIKRVALNVNTGLEEPSDIYFSSDFMPHKLDIYYKSLLDSTYILTNVFYYDYKKKFISQSNIATSSTFNCPSATRFIKLVGRRLDKGMNITLSEIKIVVGSKLYTNYFNSEVDKRCIYLDEPLYKNNYLFEEDGMVKKYKCYEMYKFTGKEDLVPFNLEDAQNDVAFEVYGLDLGFKRVDSMHPPAMSNVFPVVSTVYPTGATEGIALNQNGKVYIRINKSKLPPGSDGNLISATQSMLNAMGVTLVYELEKPTITIVENCVDLDLATYEGITHFSILNTPKGSYDFKIPTNLGSMLQSNSKEINNINNFINNTIIPLIIKNSSDIAILSTKR